MTHETLATVNERVNGLVQWQQAQNGTLQRLENKIDRLLVWLLGTGTTLLVVMVIIVFSLATHKDAVHIVPEAPAAVLQVQP